MEQERCLRRSCRLKSQKSVNESATSTGEVVMSEKRGRPSANLLDLDKEKPKMRVLDVTDVVELENVSPNHDENIPSSSTVSSNNKSVKRKASPKKRAPAKKPKDGPAEPKKRKTKLERIEEKLLALGIEPDKENGNCARAAIYRGKIKLTGNQSDLDQVILSGTVECGHTCTATLRDLLEQPDCPGIDVDGCYATVVCDQNNEIGQCGMRTYVTRICSGKPSFDSGMGKFHNHCTKCDKNGGYGRCIGDWRNEHCDNCGDHFFAGSSGLFRCDCRPASDSSDSESRDRDERDCVLM